MNRRPRRKSHVRPELEELEPRLLLAVTEVLADVPEYIWHHGCGPTSGGMVLGYWDMMGYPDYFAGDAATQTNAVNEGMATEGDGDGTTGNPGTPGTGHVPDYGFYNGVNDGAGPIEPDMSTVNPGGAHADNCIADYMHTSRSADGMTYGGSSGSMIDNGLDEYANQVGYAVAVATYDGTPTWSELVAEIDAGRPLVVEVDTNGDGYVDHFVAGVGYRITDTGRQDYGFHSTWGGWPGVNWQEFRAMGQGVNWGIWTFTYFRPCVGQPDLVGTNTEVAGPLTWGQTFDYDWEVTNYGTATAGASTLKFYLSYNSDITDMDEWRGSQSVPSLAGGASASGTKSLTLPMGPPEGFTEDDYVWIGVLVDANGNVTEGVEDNNDNVRLGRDYVGVTINGRPDLLGTYFDSVDDLLTAGETFQVDFTVANVGHSAAGGFWVDFYISDDSDINEADRRLGWYWVSGVAANSNTGVLSKALSMPAVGDPYWSGKTEGTYWIGMIVDHGPEYINETSETNNWNRGHWLDMDDVAAYPNPVDLFGTHFDVLAAGALRAGDSFDVEYRVANDEAGTADWFWVDFYISTDGVIDDVNDLRLGYEQIAGLGPYTDTGILTRQLYLPEPDHAFWQALGNATYTIGMIIDHDAARIVETDETNNDNEGLGLDLDTAYIHGNPVDLYGTYFDVTTDPLWAGDSFDVRFRVANDEAGTAAGFWVDFFVSTDGVIEDVNDRRIGWQWIANLGGNSDTGILVENVTLPAAGDAFWNTKGNATYQIGMIIDHDMAFIEETDETNNANRGGGLDLDGVYILGHPFDFGDADEPYPTLLASNGARHTIQPGFFLGNAVDGEPDGQPNPAATGDDNDETGDDEDGVSFLSPLARGEMADIRVSASLSGLLSAWVDFNGDGDWDGPDEQIFTDRPLAVGDNGLSFAVPADATIGGTIARFRFSSAGGLSFDGLAPDGEVEDHAVEIVPLPTLSISDAVVDPEGDAGTTDAVFTVSLSGPAPFTVAVSYAAIDGTAVAGLDYLATSDTLTFDPGEISRPVTVAVIGDNIDELDEVLFVNLFDPTNAVIADGEGVGTIVDDDTAGITVVPTSGLVTTEGGGQANFAVGLQSEPLANVVIDLWSGDVTEGTVSPTTLTFTPDNWGPQEVTVVGEDDPMVDGDVAYMVVTNLARSDDPMYNELNPADVSVTNLDDDFDADPPTVTGVRVSGSGWAVPAYSIPVGSAAQLDSLGWNTIDQIEVAFSEDVMVSMGDLGLYGVNVPEYGFADIAYDPATHTGTWMLTGALGIDKLLLVVGEGVTDAAANALDGEWVDGISTYPSGDGDPGGELLFRFNVLPGGANGDDVVDGADYTAWADHYDQFTTLYSDGDFNADGYVDGADYTAWADNYNQMLPPGEPVGLGAAGARAPTGPTNATATPGGGSDRAARALPVASLTAALAPKGRADRAAAFVHRPLAPARAGSAHVNAAASLDDGLDLLEAPDLRPLPVVL